VTYEIRAFTEDEYEMAYRVLSTCFGEDVEDEGMQRERTIFEFDRSLAAFDGGQLIGTAGAYSFDLTLPGGRAEPVAGVTWVGVLPTHRRQGVQRSMMVRQLDDVAERGEVIAVLTASEGQIYGRYGYGLATSFARAHVRTLGTALDPEPDAGGRFHLLDSQASLKVIPAVHDAFRRARPGVISRSARWWEMWATDPKDWRDGASARYIAVHEDAAGRADGFANYRIKQDHRPDHPGNTVVVAELVATDPEVEAALFRYLLNVDLVWELKLDRRPLDDPLRWRLVDPRRYETRTVADWLWVRLVDVAAALERRTYAAPGRLAIGVHDRLRPATDGVYVLEIDDDGSASCRRADAGTEPDVTLPVEALGAAYLGGVRLSTLADAGRADGTREALQRADAIFSSTPLPFCDLPF
jgi:predicted acetyltransferase